MQIYCVAQYFDANFTKGYIAISKLYIDQEILTIIANKIIQHLNILVILMIIFTTIIEALRTITIIFQED